ncbi:uncharacterized protein [Drosophila bipectinata]|uniref:uncharacterized protein n=1 Tax=Drosophila bipectinata TaxID=42026 RepID=UPI0007E6A504|nr:uncharacterized protein LOC108132239 [Drosophila bipectinata]
MSASVARVELGVLQPIGDLAESLIALIVRWAIIFHESLLEMHQEPEPVVDVSQVIPLMEKMVRIVHDPPPEIRPVETAVISEDSVIELLTSLESFITWLFLSTTW